MTKFCLKFTFNFSWMIFWSISAYSIIFAKNIFFFFIFVFDCHQFCPLSSPRGQLCELSSVLMQETSQRCVYACRVYLGVYVAFQHSLLTKDSHSFNFERHFCVPLFSHWCRHSSSHFNQKYTKSTETFLCSLHAFHILYNYHLYIVNNCC